MNQEVLSMKKYILMAAVLAAVLTVLTACSKWDIEIRNPEDDSESISSEDSLSTEGSSGFITEDMTGIDATGLLRYKIMYYNPFEGMEPDGSEEVEWSDDTAKIFIYESYQCKYEVFEYRAENITATVNQLVKATMSRMNSYIPEDSFSVSVRVEKSMAIVDFYNTTESFWGYLENDKTCAELLNSVAMTLIKGAGFEHIGFTAEGGGQFKTDSVTLDGNGYGRYIPAELYGEISDEEFAELRAQMEYDDSKKNEFPRGYGYGNVLSIVYDDAAKLRPEGMDVLLAHAGYTGEFDSPDDIDDEIKIRAALDGIDTVGTFYGDDYSPAADAISGAVMDDFIPREWVEEFVRDVFGPEAEVGHLSTNHYIYHAKVGVYTPPHMGGWSDYFPYVFSVSETEEGYEAEVAYIYIGMGGYGVMPGFWHAEFDYDYNDLEDDPKAMDFIKNTAPRFKVTFKKTDEGELYMASSEKLFKEMSEEYREIAAKYIAPIHYIAVNETWSDPNEISGKGFYFSYFSMAHNLIFGKWREAAHYGIEGENPFGNGEEISAEEIEGTLAKHFESDFASLRSEYYDSEKGTYYAPTYAGFGEAVFPYVTYVKETDGVLKILYDLVNENGNVFATKELRIDISDPENWKYTDCYES